MIKWTKIENVSGLRICDENNASICAPIFQSMCFRLPYSKPLNIEQGVILIHLPKTEAQIAWKYSFM